MNEILSTIIETLEKCSCLDDCYNILDNYCETITEFHSVDLNLFQYNDIFIRTGKVFNLKSVSETLENISVFNLKTAPILIKTITCKNKDDIIIITKIQNCQNSEITKYILNKNNLNKNAKADILHDFDRLAEENIYNPVITDSFSNWFVVAGNLYIDNWTQIKTFTNDKEKEELRNNLLELLSF